MVTRDLERIRFVTQHFNDLQGLRYGVPLGMITLACWGGAPLLRVLLVLGAFLLLLGGKWYYRQTFGEVEQQPVDPAAELCPASIFDPAGSVSRLEGFRQVSSITRHFLITVALAVVAWGFFQTLPPDILIKGIESPGAPLQIIPKFAFETEFDSAFLHGSSWLGPLPLKRGDDAMRRAAWTQAMYVLYGSLFLGLWLWREGRGSQSHHLIPALLLLGLAAFGAALGFFARPGGAIPPDIALFLPVLIDPGTALLLCGSAMVLTGLFDHWQMVRALGRQV